MGTAIRVVFTWSSEVRLCRSVFHPHPMYPRLSARSIRPMRRRADEFSGRCVGGRHSRVLTVAWIVVVGLPVGVVAWAVRPYRDGCSVGKDRRGTGP